MTEKLKAHFPAEKIKWRAGATNKDKTKAMALAYIDARDVMDRLDEAVGYQNWQTQYIPLENGTMICSIGIKIGNEWVWKADGAGQTDFEGEKGSISGALKRAGVAWGIGRYLYDLPVFWVKYDAQKKKLLETPNLSGETKQQSKPTEARLDTSDGTLSKDEFFATCYGELKLSKEADAIQAIVKECNGHYGEALLAVKKQFGDK